MPTVPLLKDHALVVPHLQKRAQLYAKQSALETEINDLHTRRLSSESSDPDGVLSDQTDAILNDAFVVEDAHALAQLIHKKSVEQNILKKSIDKNWMDLRAAEDQASILIINDLKADYATVIQALADAAVALSNARDAERQFVFDVDTAGVRVGHLNPAPFSYVGSLKNHHSYVRSWLNEANSHIDVSAMGIPAATGQDF